VNRKIAIIAALVLLVVAALLPLILPVAPKVYATFPEVLSAAQRKDIPITVRKETRRRMFALLKRGQLKAAWSELRSANSQRIIAVAYEPSNTNKIWVYLGKAMPGTPSPLVSTIYPMTNTQRGWIIADR